MQRLSLFANRSNRGKRGLVSVETALLLPVMFTMVMAVIEGGSMLHSWMALQKASQMGARFAATGQGEEEGSRMSQIHQVTTEWLDQLDDGAKTITISSWPGYAAAGGGTAGCAGGPCDMVEVAVTYEYKPFTPFIGDALPKIIKLSGVDRKLNEPWKPCDSGG